MAGSGYRRQGSFGWNSAAGPLFSNARHGLNTAVLESCRKIVRCSRNYGSAEGFALGELAENADSNEARMRGVPISREKPRA
jgi:hypothetical protein